MCAIDVLNCVKCHIPVSKLECNIMQVRIIFVSPIVVDTSPPAPSYNKPFIAVGGLWNFKRRVEIVSPWIHGSGMVLECIHQCKHTPINIFNRISHDGLKVVNIHREILRVPQQSCSNPRVGILAVIFIPGKIHHICIQCNMGSIGIRIRVGGDCDGGTRNAVHLGLWWHRNRGPHATKLSSTYTFTLHEGGSRASWCDKVLRQAPKIPDLLGVYTFVWDLGSYRVSCRDPQLVTASPRSHSTDSWCCKIAWAFTNRYSVWRSMMTRCAHNRWGSCFNVGSRAVSIVTSICSRTY